MLQATGTAGARTRKIARCTAFPLLAFTAANVLAQRDAAPSGALEREIAMGGARFAASGCSVCHGSDGAGTDLGPRLAVEALTPEQFTASLRQSLRTMPAFDSNTLSDRDAAAIYAFLASRGRSASAAGRGDVGATLFAAYGCYSCHSNEAQGGMHGPRLGPDPITFARFSWYVRHPSATMPPYSPVVLSEQDIADIYAFVASRPAPPPLDRIPLLAP
jgi:mono/diheme cytochrome c family protein